MNTKRWLSLLMAICMIVGMVPSHAFAAETDAPVTVKPVTDNVNEVVNPVVDKAEPQSDAEYSVLEPNMDILAEITTGGQYVYYSVTPNESCTYSFTSQSDYDTYGHLYDADMNELASDDDGGESYRQFRIVYSLEAGVTYVLGVRFYSSGQTGEILVSMDHAYYGSELIQDANCGEARTYLCRCNYCSVEWYEYPVLEHSYQSELTVEPTCTEPGSRTYTCINCGDTYPEEVPAYGHSYSAGICWRCGEAPEEFTLGVDYTVDYEANGNNIYYSFTPAETGFYTFNYQYDMAVYLNGEYQLNRTNYATEDGRVFVIYLEAGNTYSLQFTSYQYGEYTIGGEKIQVLEQNVDAEVTHIYDDSYVGRYFVELSVEELDYYALRFTGYVSDVFVVDTSFYSVHSASGVHFGEEDTIRGYSIALEPGNYLVLVTTDPDATEAAVRLEDAPDPESIDAYDMIMIPHENRLVSLYPQLVEGGLCNLLLTFEVSDPSIANVVARAHGDYYVEAYSPGTVTITGTTVNGISATITVTVKDPVELTYGEAATVTVAGGDKEVFSFVAETEGWYGFDMDNPGISMEMSTNNPWEGWYNKPVDDKAYYFAYLYAGCEYMLVARNNDETSDRDVTVTVNPSPEPTEIILSETMMVFTGNYYHLYAQFDSVWAWANLEWDYTAENNAAYINAESYINCQFYARDEGTMTVTASYTKADGTVISDSCVVTILDALPLELDVPAEITVDSWHNFRVSFTPEVSGWYQVESGNALYVDSLRDQDGNYLDHYRDSYRSTMYMEAGVKYTIYLYNGTELEQNATVVLNQVPEMALDGSVYAELEYNESRFFTFTPEVSGYYSATSDFRYANINILDGNTTIAYGQNADGVCWATAYLEAGKTYAVRFHHYYAEAQSMNMGIQVAPAPVTIGLNYETDDIGQVGDTYRFWVNFNPYYTRDVVTVTSADESILAFTGVDGNYFLFEAKAEGTVTVTATTAGGLETTLTVTVKNPIVLELGAPASAVLEQNQRERFVLSAPAEGWYVVRTLGDVGVECWFNSTKRSEAGEQFYYIWLNEGEAYSVTANNLSEDTHSITVEIRQAEEPSAISLSADAVNFVDVRAEVKLDFGSYWAYADVSWTLTINGEQAWFNDTNNATAHFYPREVGTAVVVASVDKADATVLTASITLEILDAQPLELNVPVHIEVGGYESYRVSFTPDVSGVYTLQHSAQIRPNRIEANGEYFDDYFYRGSTTVAYLEAGVEYVFELYNQNGYMNTADVVMTELNPAVLEPGVQTNAVVSDGGEMVFYTFVPAESGKYYFTSYADRDTYGYLFDAQLNVIDEDDDGVPNSNNFYITAELEAGQTYFLAVRYYSSNYIGSIPVMLDATPAPTEVYLNYRYGNVGEVGDTYYFWINYEPWYAWDEIASVTSSDESILSFTGDINWEGQWLFQANAEGTATITVTTLSGLTVSQDVTVQNPIPLALGERVYADLDYREEAYYALTVEEAGFYGALATVGISVDINGGHSNYYIETEDGSTFCRVYLEAGEYLITIRNNLQFGGAESNVRTVSLLADVVAPAQTITLPESVTGFLGRNLSVSPDFGSLWNYSPVTWSLEQDGEYVILENQYQLNAYLSFLAEGTATLTATTDNGLIASTTITVVDALELVLGQDYPLTLNPGDSVIYKFTPTEDMVATVTCQGLNFEGIWRTDGEMVMADGGLLWLEAGVEYRFGVNCWSDYPVSGVVRAGTPVELVKDAPVQADGTEKEFLVKPATSGWYMIKLDQKTGYYAELRQIAGVGELAWVQANTYTGSNYRYYVFWLEAGCEYFVTAWDGNVEENGTYTGSITLTDCIKPERLEIGFDSRSVLVGGSTRFYVEFYPNYSRDNVTVTVADGTIAQVVHEEGNIYLITGLAGGSTTVTFSTADGLSASQTIDVVQPGTLEEATVASGTLVGNGGSAYYQFVAPADGMYAIRYTLGMEMSLSGRFETYDVKSYGDDYYRYVYLYAGQNYLIALRNFESDRAYEVEWRACTEPTALVVPEIIRVAVGGSTYVNAQFATPWEYGDGGIRVETQDGETGIECGGNTIYGLVAGTYTVTVIYYGQEAPLTATATVIVTDPIPLTLNERHSFTLAHGESAAFAFQVTTPGYYLIPRMINVSWELTRQTEYGWQYVDWRTSFNSNRLFELAPGNYRITVRNESGEDINTAVTVATPVALSLYEDVRVQLNAYDARMFSFTPETSGRYVFARYGINYTGSYQVWTSNLETVPTSAIWGEGNEHFVVAELEAGKTYYFINYTNNTPMDFVLTLLEPHQPESFEIFYENYNVTRNTAVVGDYLYLGYRFNPAYCVEDVTLTFSDATMARLEYQEGNYAEVKLLKPGRLTITATSESGITSSITINVVEPEIVNLELGQPQTVTVAPGQAFTMVYEVPEGEYDTAYLYYMSESQLTAQSLGYGGGGEYDRLVDGYNVIVQNWGRNRTYFNFTSSPITVEIGVKIPTTPDSVSLRYDELTLIIGSGYTLAHTFHPFDSWESVEWSSSNPDVAYVENNEGYGGYVYGRSEGTAVITATTPSGITASCTVTVKYPDILGEIQLDQPMSHTMATMDDYAVYTFTAPESGSYFFAAMANSDAFLSLYTTDWEYIDENDDYNRLHSGMWLEMAAGETVIVLGKLYGNEWGDSVTVVVSTNEDVYTQFVPGAPLTLGEKVPFTTEGEYSKNFHFIPDASGWYAIHGESGFGFHVAVEMYEFGAYVGDKWLNPTGDSLVVYLEADVPYMIYAYSEEADQAVIWIDDDAKIPMRLEIITKPDRLTYVKDYVVYDLSGLVYKITWTDGSVTTHSYDEDGGWLDGFSLYAEYCEDHNDGTATIYLTIDGMCSASYDVKLIPNPVKAVEILYADQVPAFIEGGYGTLNSDGSFHYSTLLAVRKIRFLVTYTDGTTEILSVEDTIEGCYFDAYTQFKGVGQENYILFSILGHEARLDVEFAVNPVKSIEIVSGPNALVYGQDGRVSMDEEGNVYFEIDWANGYDGMSIRINYTDGTSEVISYADMTRPNTGEMIFDMPEYKGYPVDVTYYLPEYGSEFAYWIGGHMYPNEDGVIPMSLHYMGHYLTFELPVADNNGTVTIVTQPQDVTALLGETVEVTVEAIGDGLTYQWYFAAANATKFSKSSNTTNTYTTTMTEARNGYRVYCVITDKYGNSVTSDTATLTLVDLKITKQPTSVRVPNGESVTLTVEAVGDGLTYQWYFAAAGATEFQKSSAKTATYTTTMTEARDGYRLYCVVTDKYGNSVTSDTATISMATELQILSQPEDTAAHADEEISVSVLAVGDGLTYQWYYAAANATKFQKSSNTTDTYTTTMNATRNGYRVYCVITDQYGHSLTTDTVTLSLIVPETPLEITKQPEDVTVAEGETATVTVEVTGDGLTYQWYYTSNGTSNTFFKSSNTTATYSTTMDATRDGRKVYCVITDQYGNSVTSNTVTLSLEAAATELEITKQPEDVTVAVGETASVTVEAIGDGLTYQWYYTSNGTSNTFFKSSNTTATYSTTMDATRDGRKVYCVITDQYGNSVTSNTVTLSLEAAATELEITKQPEDVTVAVGETASVTVEAIGDGLTYQWYYTSNGTSNTFFKSSNTTATYSTTMDASRDGRKVYCVITDQYGNSVTSNTVTLSLEAAATELEITKQPEDVTAKDGESISVSVEATGDGLTYQWYFAKAGSTTFQKSSNTTAIYTTTMTVARDGYRVYCVITDQYGSTVTTNTVTLTMEKEDVTPLEITKQPEDVTVAEGETATVTVEVTGDGLTYQWYYTSNGQTSTFYKSSNTTNTYSTTMDATRDGRKVYCVITDQYGQSVISNTVTLIMDNGSDAIVITQQPEDVAVAEGESVSVTVEATGEELTYQWYFAKAGSNTFQKSSNTTNTYTTTMTAARNGYRVYCLITDKNGNTAMTQVVTLMMLSNIEITKQPENVTAADGEEISVMVEANGEGLTYQWYYAKAGSNTFFKSSNTTNTYTTTMTAARNGYRVYCVITDQNGSTVMTDIVTLTMG